MFTLATFDESGSLGDTLNAVSGAGGVLFVVSYVVVPPPHPLSLSFHLSRPFLPSPLALALCLTRTHSHTHHLS
jgi:hypothetical protein